MAASRKRCRCSMSALKRCRTERQQPEYQVQMPDLLQGGSCRPPAGRKPIKCSWTPVMDAYNHESWQFLPAAGKGLQLSSRQRKTRVQLNIACFRRLERLARVLGPLVQTRLQATTGFSSLLKLLAAFYKLLATAVGINLAPKGARRGA